MTWAIRNARGPAELVHDGASGDWPRLTVDEIVRHRPDASIVAHGETHLLARCSLWWSDAPPMEGHRVGAIGHFAADDADAGHAVLAEACRQLQHAGCTVAVGPMDGNTWRRYRLVVDHGTEPPFFLEPTNPVEWPGYFRGAGFSVLANYMSGLNRDLSVRDPRGDELEARFGSRGIAIRQLNMADFEAELARIYAVASVSFRSGLLYTPLAEAEFVAQYAAVRGMVLPELVLVAEDQGRTVGFTFCLPDVLEKQRTGVLRTIIIKTLAILPERERYGGLGSLMVDRVHRTAQSMGLQRVIHALMHETNQSRMVSDRTGGSTMRRYALFARELARG